MGFGSVIPFTTTPKGFLYSLEGKLMVGESKEIYGFYDFPVFRLARV